MPDTLTPITRFTLGPAAVPAPQCSELVLDGTATGKRVRGVQLVAQYAYGDRFLLLVDEDCPYEGYLYALLLGPHLDAIEQRELGVPYAAGFVTNLRVSATDALEFSFFGSDRWRLRVLSIPRLMWVDWNRPPTRQWHRLLSKRWLALDQIA